MQGGESGSRQEFLFITGVLLLAPPASGGRSLPGTAWRRRRAGPQSLVALLGGLDPLLGKSVYWRGSDGSGRPPGISSTTGGRSARGMQEVAAASGGSAPTSNLTSGRAAHGGV